MKTKSPPKPKPRVAVAPVAKPHRDLWFLLALIAIGLAVYWRSLFGPFLYDDIDIFEARSSARLQNWHIILTGPRPLTILTYALQQRLAGGFDPFQFHLLNLVVHLMNALTLLGITRLLCKLPSVAACLAPRARQLLVWAVPLLFLASPIQTESVSYVSSRSELLKTGPYLAAILVFLSSWREKRPWVTALLVTFFYGAAVAGKEDGLTLPAAILLLDYLLVSERDWRRVRRNWPVYALLGAVMVLGAWIKVRPLLNVPSAGFFLKDVTWKDYLFTQFRMYFLYLRLLLVPFGLNVDHDIEPSRTLLQHGSWLALAGIIVLIRVAIYFRRRVALASFGILFYFLTLFPTSSFYPLLDYAAERRLYLPSIGFFLAMLALVSARWPDRRELAAALTGVVVIYAAGTYARNRVWEDPLVLWQDTAEKSSRKWRVFTWLGREYSARKMFEQAEQAYQRSAELIPEHSKDKADVLYSLGSTYANRKMYSQALELYEKALKINPYSSTLWTNLAITELRLNRPEGWQHFERAIHANALAWEPHFVRGNMYYELKRYDDAIRDYERVLDLLPDHPDAQYNLNAARAMKLRQQGGK